MKKHIIVIPCILLLFAFNAYAQKDIKITYDQGLISSKEEKILGKAIQYEADFFNRLFPDKQINITDIKFTVVTDYIKFISVQSRAFGSTHNISGFFSPKDSSLFVYKDRKTSSDRFLQTSFHEMAHAFLTLYSGQKYLPPWFNEGLAVYLERMSFEKKKISQKIDMHKINRVKTLIELKDIDLSDFAEWNYNKFSSESFSQEGYGYCVGYCMVYFLMQKDETRAIKIFQHLIGSNSSIKIFDQHYPGGFVQFEKEFMEYYEKH